MFRSARRRWLLLLVLACLAAGGAPGLADPAPQTVPPPPTKPEAPPPPGPARPGAPAGRPLVARAPRGTVASFANPAPMALFSDGSGTNAGYGTPNATSVTVSGLPARLTAVTVTVKGINGIPGGLLGLLVVAPDGSHVSLQFRCGDGNFPATNADVTFDDRSPASLTLGPPLASGTFHPCEQPGAYPAPAPPPPAGGDSPARLTNLHGIDPNGTWFLWAYSVDWPGATIAGGWQLDLTADTPPATTPVGPFANAAPMTINDAAPASLYPSTVTASGVPPGMAVVSATVGLSGFSHAFPRDVGVLLVSPDGRAALPYFRCGANSDAVGVTLNLGAAGNLLPAGGYLLDPAIPNGPSRPTACYGFSDFEAPAPSQGPMAPYGNPLTDLAGATGNGTWSLYVQDFAGFDAGQLDGGWTLTLYVAPVPTPTPTATATPTSTATATTTAAATATVTATGTHQPTGTTTATGTAAPTATGTAVPPVTSTVTPATTASTSTTPSSTATGTPTVSVSVAGGSGQSAPPGSPYPIPLQVLVSGSGGPVTGASVTFTAPSSGSSCAFPNGVTSITVQAGANGVASLTCTPNSAPGSFQVAASVAGGGTVMFTLSIVAVTPTPVIPEAPPLWLFGSGLLVMGWFAAAGRRRAA